ncbi:HAD-IIB family hydrolase (plasmid) [Agrobacterium vitis]|uniref:HAD family hydrolase n=1 Tax=Agrobacterium vitis TaxID=373 RepID=UPI003D274461
MYFRALAADYDGTLAHHGAMEQATVDALVRLRRAGRQIILVTGREMADLRHIVPDMTLFDRIVAENGGVLYDPVRGSEVALAPGPPPALVQKLMEHGVEPMSAGQSIIATWQPHEAAVLAAIAELGLDEQIIFNKGAVMVLPAGVNKASGLVAALQDLGLSKANVVGVGDAENDLAFLVECGASAAVANALSSLREACDITLMSDHGAGVRELINRLLKEDFELIPPSRRGVSLGIDADANHIWLTPQDSLLIIGGSGSGKSRFATALVERMINKNFSVCLLDPEGEYEDLDRMVAIGDQMQAGSIDEASRLLSNGMSVAFGTVAITLDQRQCLFERLLPRIETLRKTSGRPHWIIADEAHHYLPASCIPTSEIVCEPHAGLVLATITPDWLHPAVVGAMDYVMAFGSTAFDIVQKFSVESTFSKYSQPRLGPDEALLWSRVSPHGPRRLKIEGPRHHERHKGKYAIGDVGDAHSFYFGWSPDGQVYRARNLAEFLSKADHLPEEIWLRHLHTGDFAAWFLHVIRDDELARRAKEIAEDASLGAKESREQIAVAICDRYTIAR